jgi:DNA-binding PadR family transcriptional regulator
VGRTGQVNDGVLYPLLARLEAEGLVRKRVERGAGARERHVLRVTPRGARVFGEWLRGPAGEEDEVTYDFFLGHPFLVKCMFFARLPQAATRAKLRAQAAMGRQKLATFRDIRRDMRARGVDRWRVAVLDLGITQQQARVRWLERLAATRPRKE